MGTAVRMCTVSPRNAGRVDVAVSQGLLVSRWCTAVRECTVPLRTARGVDVAVSQDLLVSRWCTAVRECTVPLRVGCRIEQCAIWSGLLEWRWNWCANVLRLSLRCHSVIELKCRGHHEATLVGVALVNGSTGRRCHCAFWIGFTI